MLRTDAASGHPSVLHLSAGVHTLDDAPFDFDERIRASEVRLVGVPGAALRATAAGAPVLRMLLGAPRLSVSAPPRDEANI